MHQLDESFHGDILFLCMRVVISQCLGFCVYVCQYDIFLQNSSGKSFFVYTPAITETHSQHF